MTTSPSDDAMRPLTIEDVYAELLHVVTQLSRRSDPSLETEESLAAAQVVIDDRMIRLKAYPNELRRTILEYGRDPKRSAVFLWVQDGWSVAKFNEYFAFQQAFQHEDPTRVLAGLRFHPQLAQTEDYTTLDENVQRQIHALITVTKALVDETMERGAIYLNGGPKALPLPIEHVGEDRSASKIAGDDLINLILEYPQHADWIAQIIIERSSSDANLIRSIITSGAPSLSNGTL